MRFLLTSIALLTAITFFTGCNRTPSAEIKKILDTKDDFELCSALYKALGKHYDGEADVSKFSEKDRAVILVLYTSSLIDNGGFQYLFEGEIESDPYFTHAVAAYKTINASICAEAFDEALKLFPESKPPQQIRKRLAMFQAVPKAQRDAIDSKFFSQSKHLSTLLAQYIRDNRAAFEHI